MRRHTCVHVSWTGNELVCPMPNRVASRNSLANDVAVRRLCFARKCRLQHRTRRLRSQITRWSLCTDLGRSSLSPLMNFKANINRSYAFFLYNYIFSLEKWKKTFYQKFRSIIQSIQHHTFPINSQYNFNWKLVILKTLMVFK